MSARPLSRRELLARSGAIAGGAVLLGTGALGARRVWADTPDPSGWAEPVVRASQGGRLATTFRVAKGDVPIARESVSARTYESSYPGPTLDINAGDELAVDLVNDGDQDTNLHTHGLHVSPQQPSDDVLLNIVPGKGYAYRYAVPADHPGGTYWYHAHRHMLSDDQVFGGLFGMLVVRGQLDQLPGVLGLEERALIMSQCQVIKGAVADASTSSLSDQVTLVNARYQPTVDLTTGQTQRWRLVNTSSIFLRLQLDGHPLHVIAIDGNALPAPVAKTVLEIPPGGRADVLVQADTAGRFALRSLSWQSLGVFYTSMVPEPQILAHMTVSGKSHVTPNPLPKRLLPLDDLRGVKVDRRRVFRLEEREPRGVGPIGAYEYYINGREFDATKVQERIPLNATEEWEFLNLTYEPHPLHIHVNPFQIVKINGKGPGESHYRDTALVPPFGSLTIRHRFLDYTGIYPMHCHILFHEDHGMMELLEVYGKEGPTGVGPQTPMDPNMPGMIMAG